MVEFSLLTRVYPLIFHHSPPPSFAAEVVDVDINSISTTLHTQQYLYDKCLSSSNDR